MFLEKYIYNAKAYLELVEKATDDEMKYDLLVLVERNIRSIKYQLQRELPKYKTEEESLGDPEADSRESIIFSPFVESPDDKIYSKERSWPPEKRKRVGRTMKEIWASRTPEEKDAIRAKMKAAIRKTYERRRQGKLRKAK
jgi:hypothetical protein